MTPKSNPKTFVAVLILALSFWLFSVFDRIYLGMHALNQLLLGSQVGIWCALFCHFVLRDSIFAHIAKLCHEKGVLEKRRALKYVLVATLVVILTILVSLIIGYIMIGSYSVEQDWLRNLRDACGENFKVDREGNLISNFD